MGQSTGGGIAASVRKAIADGDAWTARRQLAGHLAGDGEGGDDASWADSLAALAALGEDWGYPTLRDRAGAADASDPSALLAIGQELVEHDVPELAEPVLRRSVALGGAAEAIAELVAALEVQGRYEEAVEVLGRGDAASSDPVCAFLLGFSAVLLRDVELAGRQLDVVAGFDGEPAATMAANLRAMLGRAGELRGRLGDDLVAWQFVWTGGLLLDAEVRSGLGSWADVRRSLDALRALLGRPAGDRPGGGTAGARTAGALGGPPAAGRQLLAAPGGQLLAAPDRASQALGVALQHLEQAEVGEWYGDDDREGLLVVHDVTGLDPELRARLRTRPAGLLLYVHTAPADRESAVAGDLLGSLGLGYRPPWAGGPGPGGSWASPDSADAAGLADRIVGAPAGEAAVPGVVSDLIDSGSFRPGPAPGGTRSRQWALPVAFRR